MDIELAARRRQIQTRKEQLQGLIAQKKQYAREVRAHNESMIQLMNMELQNLRLQFAQQQIKENNPIEQRGTNLERGCCCLVVAQDDLQPSSSRSSDLGSFFKVRDDKEYFMNLKELKSRKQQLGTCKCGCCHQISSCIARDVCNYLNDIPSVMVFSFAGLWLCYSLLSIVLLPWLYLFRCFESCVNWCYSRGSRTDRILDIYLKYSMQIDEIFVTLP